MRHTLALITATVAALIALAILPPSNHVQAQSGEPAAVYWEYLPLVMKPSSSQTSADEQVANDILALVNSERAKVGCPPVTVAAKLVDAAQAHSADMAIHNYFSHTSLDGTSASQRVTRAGYAWSMTGENIAAGYATAAQVMQGWMESSGHRANILRCSYTEMGVGYYYEAQDSYPGSYGYRHYWTQVFAKPQ